VLAPRLQSIRILKRSLALWKGLFWVETHHGYLISTLSRKIDAAGAIAGIKGLRPPYMGVRKGLWPRTSEVYGCYPCSGWEKVGEWIWVSLAAVARRGFQAPRARSNVAGGRVGDHQMYLHMVWIDLS